MPRAPRLDFATLRRALMRGDLLSSYALAAVRVGVWAVIAALSFRAGGAAALAAVTLARTIITILNYLGFGLAPALVVLLPQFAVQTVPPIQPPSDELGYEPVPPPRREYLDARLYETSRVLAHLVVVASTVVFACVVSSGYFSIRSVGNYFPFFLFMGGAALCRIIGDVGGARLAAQERLTLDNVLQITTECVWLGAMVLILVFTPEDFSGSRSIDTLTAIAGGYIAASLLSILLRHRAGQTRYFLRRVRRLGSVDQDGADELEFNAKTLSPFRRFLDARGVFDSDLAKLLLVTGGGILLSQMADLLYGPANVWLISVLLGAKELAVYAPTLHLDAGLLLLVAGPAAVLLPRAAVLKAAGDAQRLRRDYLLATLGSFAALSAAAGVICLLSGPIFRAWFGDPLPATRAVLPWVMVHTVLGGTAAVGRSVLIGIGRVKAYTTAALIGGVCNVALALVLVTTTDLGIYGVILATIVTVGVRCAIWMPWYTLRAIREVEQKTEHAATA